MPQALWGGYEGALSDPRRWLNEGEEWFSAQDATLSVTEQKFDSAVQRSQSHARHVQPLRRHTSQQHSGGAHIRSASHRHVKTAMDRWEDHVSDFHLNPSTTHQLSAIRRADVKDQVLQSLLRPELNCNFLPENHRSETQTANASMLYHNMPFDLHTMVDHAVASDAAPHTPREGHPTEVRGLRTSPRGQGGQARRRARSPVCTQNPLHPKPWEGPSASDPRQKWRSINDYHVPSQRSAGGRVVRRAVQQQGRQGQQSGGVAVSSRGRGDSYGRDVTTQTPASGRRGSAVAEGGGPHSVDPIALIASRISSDRHPQHSGGGGGGGVSGSGFSNTVTTAMFPDPYTTPPGGVRGGGRGVGGGVGGGLGGVGVTPHRRSHPPTPGATPVVDPAVSSMGETYHNPHVSMVSMEGGGGGGGGAVGQGVASYPSTVTGASENSSLLSHISKTGGIRWAGK